MQVKANISSALSVTSAAAAVSTFFLGVLSPWPLTFFASSFRPAVGLGVACVFGALVIDYTLLRFLRDEGDEVVRLHCP